MAVSSVTPCFTPGTLIATDRGAQPVETLMRGNRIVTRDNGLRRIEWVGRRVVPLGELKVLPELRPILVAADAFGPGRPARDMMVSPAHRFLVSFEDVFQNLAEPEALVAARHLINGRTIRHVPVLGVSYVHLLCDRHEVILANGAWTESFHPDDRIMRGMGNSQRRELVALFPEIETIGASARFPGARPISRLSLGQVFRG
jgi:hypothetical protein